LDKHFSDDSRLFQVLNLATDERLVDGAQNVGKVSGGGIELCARRVCIVDCLHFHRVVKSRFFAVPYLPGNYLLEHQFFVFAGDAENLAAPILTEAIGRTVSPHVFAAGVVLNTRTAELIRLFSEKVELFQSSLDLFNVWFANKGFVGLETIPDFLFVDQFRVVSVKSLH